MTGKHTILYAEDDMDDLFMVQEAFAQHGQIEVVHAPNGARALELLRNLQKRRLLPCLVILDINMPVMDGKETLESIRADEELKVLPVVLFSTSNSAGDLQFAARWGVDLVTKPLHFSDLEVIASKFVDRCNFEINKLNELK